MNVSWIKSASESRLVFLITGVRGVPAVMVLLVVAGLFTAVSLLLQSWLHASVLLPFQMLAIRLTMILVGQSRRLWLAVAIAAVFAGGMSTIAFGYLYLGSSLFRQIERPTWVARERKEAIRDLLSSDQVSELERKVGHWGRLLKYPDGSWTAIWYNDTHSFLVASCAVVRDSDGKWLTGEYHFCGTLMYTQQLAKRLSEYRAELQNATNSEDKDYWTNMIELQQSTRPTSSLVDAKSAADARRVLVEEFNLRTIPTPVAR